MNITAFWKIIDDSLEEAEGDIEEQMEFLGEMLEELEPDEIVEFDRIFLEQWGPRVHVGPVGCSVHFWPRLFR